MINDAECGGDNFESFLTEPQPKEFEVPSTSISPPICRASSEATSDALGTCEGDCRTGFNKESFEVLGSIVCCCRRIPVKTC